MKKRLLAGVLGALVLVLTVGGLYLRGRVGPSAAETMAKSWALAILTAERASRLEPVEIGPCAHGGVAREHGGEIVFSQKVCRTATGEAEVRRWLAASGGLALLRHTEGIYLIAGDFTVAKQTGSTTWRSVYQCGLEGDQPKCRRFEGKQVDMPQLP